jgi:probable addiction module antidote protein
LSFSAGGVVVVFVAMASIVHDLFTPWLAPKFPKFFRHGYEPPANRESISGPLVEKSSSVVYALQMPTTKKKSKAKPFEAAEYLDSPEIIIAYINEALESEDASAIAVAIGTVAPRARHERGGGKSRALAGDLYRALRGEAKPEFGTVIKVLHALGIDLVAQPQGSKTA